MFNRFVKNTCAALTASFAIAGSAQAVPFLWSDDFNPADPVISSQLDFTHDIRDGLTGFRPGIDTITSAFLSIVLADDALFGDIPFIGDPQEKVSFNFDGTGWTAPENVGFLDIFDFQFDTLLTDGLLGVKVRATQGDFKFLQSNLLVAGDRAAVSEPISMALFGMGLLGLAAFRRRGSKAASLAV